MRWWLWGALFVLVALIGVLLAFGGWWRGPEVAKPLPVPSDDQEIAWLHIPTSVDTWENFVWGMKRAEMASSGAPSGIHVDDSAAFPTRTTEVPEIVVSRDGVTGKLRVRWYKVTNYAPTSAWVKSLAERNPPPLAVVGGWSSDRAKSLADAMAATTWPNQKPVLLLATATAEAVESPDYDSETPAPKLIELYDRSFRFCFTNKQLADAVSDFVLTDPALRPGPAVLPGLRPIPTSAGGPWAMLPALAELEADTPGVPSFANEHAKPPGLSAFAVAWKDDPYSLDLAEQFREAFAAQSKQPGRPRLSVQSIFIPFSTGRFARPNPYETQVVDHIVGNLPRRGERTILVLPTVTAPARRMLSALSQGTPGSSRRIVAVTGDGIPVNALFRDGQFAWPVRGIQIPLVLFTHTDPFDWDEANESAKPPPGYELRPPVGLGDVKTSTEDIQLFSQMTAVLTRGAFADGSSRVVEGPDALTNRFHTLSPAFFSPSGNRLSGSGEHVVVMRPTPRIEGVVTYPDAVIEVWTRAGGIQWNLIHTRTVVQTVRPTDGGPNE